MTDFSFCSTSAVAMDAFYAARMHAFPPNFTGHHGGVIGVSIVAEATAAASRGEGVASLVVVLGSSLSLVGLVFAFITYSLFSDLRSLSGTTLMNLLAGLFMAQLLYVIGVGGVQDADLCSALSLSLQYVRLTVLCWLTASAHHMYVSFEKEGIFARASNTLPPPLLPEGRLSSSFARYSLFGWGAPILCLAASAAMQSAHDASLGHASWQPHRSRLRRPFHTPTKGAEGALVDREELVLGHELARLPRLNSSILGSSFLASDIAAAEGDCWFPDGIWTFGLGFLAPSMVLLLADAIFMFKSAMLVRDAHNLPLDRKSCEKMRQKRRLQVCLFGRVSLLIGGITALGAAARISSYIQGPHKVIKPTASPADGNESGSSIWLAFDVANALQGIVVALCVTCDCGVLRLYTRSLRRAGARRKKQQQASSSGSTSGSSACRKGRKKVAIKRQAQQQYDPNRPSKSTSLQLLTWEPTPEAL